MVGSGSNQEESVGSQRQDQFLNLERRRDRKVSVHTAHTSRSQSWGRSYISHEENTRSMQLEIDHFHKRLRHEWWRGTPLDSDPSFDDDRDGSYKPRSRTTPANLFRVMRITIMSARIGARLAKAWETMLWVRRWTKFPSHLLHIELREESFPVGLRCPRSPCTMVEQTRWSMWATSTRGWLYTPRMKPWCAKCFHPVWSLWRWDGLTA